MSIRHCILIVACLLFAASMLHAQDTPEPDTRILALAPLIPLEPWPETEDEYIRRYLQSMEEAASAGVRGYIATATWRDLEPAPGEFAFDDLVSTMPERVQAYGQTLYIGIQLINTTEKETPTDLFETPFSDAAMLRRFEALVQALAARLRDEGVADQVRYVSIGNEVDGYLQATDQWDEYTAFYIQAVHRVRRELPNAQVGVAVGFGGAQEYREQVARLNAASDVFILTYYPLNGDFTVRPPQTAASDIATMLELADSRPLVLQEVGYPASESLGSSEEAQGEFVREVFAAWDRAGSRIPFLSWFAQGDFTPQICSDYTQYYGLPNVQSFYDYLCSLGLNRVDGTPRLAWNVFAEEGARRFAENAPS